MVLNKEQRVGIFIDVQNLYHSAKNLFGSRINYKKLVEELTAGRRLVRATGYVVKTDTTEGESSFFEALEKSGVELRVKDIQIFQSGAKKADWDVGMAVDAIRAANSFDCIVLVTGDGDFIPLVEYLRHGLGKTVEVAAFSRSTSGKLKESADRFIMLEDTTGMLITSPKAREQRARKNADEAGTKTEAAAPSAPRRAAPVAPRNASRPRTAPKVPNGGVNDF